jgi:hypothetical protein
MEIFCAALLTLAVAQCLKPANVELNNIATLYYDCSLRLWQLHNVFSIAIFKQAYNFIIDNGTIETASTPGEIIFLY